jgi:hypothetical protein
VNIPFHSLVPTFRGRPLPSPPEKPFDSNHITSISLMCRSNFDEQAGERRVLSSHRMLHEAENFMLSENRRFFVQGGVARTC